MPELATKTNRRGFIAGIGAVLVAVFFAFNAFDSIIPGVSIGELLLGVGAGLTFAYGAKETLSVHHIHRDMLLLELVCIAVTLIVSSFQPVFTIKGFVYRTIRWSYYLMCALILGKRTDLTHLRKVLFLVAVAASLFLIVQVMAYRLTGKVIQLRIGDYLLGCSVENIYSGGRLAGQVVRFSSFFSEPAHFSYYVILALALELFYPEELKLRLGTITGATIIVLALILCTSTYAILLIAVLGCMLLFLIVKNQGLTARVVIGTMVAIIAVAAASYLFVKTSLGGYLIKKISSVGSTSRTSLIWQQDNLFPLLQKCFGVGIGNEEAYYRNVSNRQLGYINSVSMMFLYCGFTGVGVMSLFFVVSWTRLRNHTRVILVLFAIISLFSTAFFSTIMVLYTIAIAAGDDITSWCSGKERESLP